jgi:hypothetical protein
MANELTFLLTSTSPSVVVVTFGIGSSSLMVFSGETSGVQTSFSTLSQVKKTYLPKTWETVIHNENLTFTTVVFTLFFNGPNKPKEPLSSTEMYLQIDI